MSESGEKAVAQNGDPMQRLASLKTPRDLTLSGLKPNKKVFVPNLKATRNKNKTSEEKSDGDVRKDKRRIRENRHHKKNKHNNIIKSSGVFSEGLGGIETRSSTRISYGRRNDAPVTMDRPVIRVKEAWKIDKELEEQQVKNLVEDDSSESDNDDEPETSTDDLPVRLPLVDAGSIMNKKKLKEKYVVKLEPNDEEDAANGIKQEDIKPIVDLKKEVYNDADLITMLRGDKSTLMLLQLPDSLPGRGGKSSDTPKPSKSDEDKDNKDKTETEPEEERCHLNDLEEGRIGRLLIHRSGRIRLALGNTTFDVHPGTQTSFRQEVVSMAHDEETRSANITSLGPINHKLILVPDWESLLKDV